MPRTASYADGAAELLAAHDKEFARRLAQVKRAAVRERKNNRARINLLPSSIAARARYARSARGRAARRRANAAYYAKRQAARAAKILGDLA